MELSSNAKQEDPPLKTLTRGHTPQGGGLRKAALLALCLTICDLGCGGGGGSSSQAVTPTSSSGTVSTLPSTSRVFTLSNPGSATYALVSSGVGSTDADTSTSTASILEQGTVDRLEGSQKAAATPPTPRLRDRVASRDKLKGYVRSSKAVRKSVNYDASPTLPFYISNSGTTVTLFNRTPGVGSNPGTRPTSIITYVEQVGGQDVINATDLQRAIDAWDTSNPFGATGNTGIYNTEHQIFGSEWTAGGGNDGDPRVVCCFLSTATIGESGLYGYVDLNDELYPRGESQSNGGEIIYLQAQPSSVSNFFQGDGFDGYATFAHELEHLIIFNTKVSQQGLFPAGAPEESPTIDEGNATLAEDDCGFSLTASGGGNSFIAYAINSYETTSQASDGFFTFSANGQDYGKGYLFFKYIQDTLGASAIYAIENDTGTGSANIARHVGQSFANQLQTSSIANYVSCFASTAGYRYPDLNLAGTYSIHTNNNPADAVSQTLPGIVPSGSLAVNTAFNDVIDAFSASFLNAFTGLGTGTITVQQPSNMQTSLVEVQAGTVTNVTF